METDADHSPIASDGQGGSDGAVTDGTPRDGEASPTTVTDPPHTEKDEKSYWEECKAKTNFTLLLSILSVSCWSLAGNASRLALHGGFGSIPFMPTYQFFGPNSIGSFAMALFGAALPPESELPIVHRALCVGFCGSFTTFSSWVGDITNGNTAGAAFEELISGLTMPFIFFLWGRDMVAGARWLVGRLLLPLSSSSDRTDEATAKKQHQLFAIAQYVFLLLSCAATIAVPIAIQVRINQGHIYTVSSEDIKAVAIAPAGAVVRFLLSVYLNKRPQWSGFPVGTLAANALGVFLVVFMDNYEHHRPQNAWYWIVANGVCGALSTVSSFVNEVVGFYAADRPLMAYVYCLITLAVTITIGAIGRRGNFD